MYREDIKQIEHKLIFILDSSENAKFYILAAEWTVVATGHLICTTGRKCSGMKFQKFWGGEFSNYFNSVFFEYP